MFSRISCLFFFLGVSVSYWRLYIRVYIFLIQLFLVLSSSLKYIRMSQKVLNILLLVIQSSSTCLLSVIYNSDKRSFFISYCSIEERLLSSRASKYCIAHILIGSIWISVLHKISCNQLFYVTLIISLIRFSFSTPIFSIRSRLIQVTTIRN